MTAPSTERKWAVVRIVLGKPQMVCAVVSLLLLVTTRKANGTAYAVAGHYEEARDALQRYLSRYPNILPAHLMLAAVYTELGQTAEAQKEVSEVLRLNPKFSLEVHKQRVPLKDPATLERHIAALQKAGLK